MNNCNECKWYGECDRQGGRHCKEFESYKKVEKQEDKCLTQMVCNPFIERCKTCYYHRYTINIGLSYCKKFKKRIVDSKTFHRWMILGVVCGHYRKKDSFFDDIEYLNIDGIEYVNKHDKNCPYITCDEYQECKEQDFNVICLKEFNKNKPKKEVSKMENVKKEIEKVKEKQKEIKEEIKKVKEERLKQLKEYKSLFTIKHCGKGGCKARSISIDFKEYAFKKENLKKKKQRKIKKLLWSNNVKTIVTECYKYLSMKSLKKKRIYKLPKESWNAIINLLNTLKKHENNYHLKKEKRRLKEEKKELCRITDCYKALSDTKGKCPDCEADLPNNKIDKEIKHCQYCGYKYR